MNKILKVGILRETKTPPDKRTALAPQECLALKQKFPKVDLYIQSGGLRSYSDSEYTNLGLNVVENVENCDILIGVKEVALDKLIANKTYMFFSHTAKMQEYNRPLLKEILKKNIRLIDYEYLTDSNGIRLVAFGRWAGLVGTYNGIMAYGIRNKLFELKRAVECKDTDEMFSEIKKIKLPPVKILITGGGRVAGGALETLSQLNITEISPEDFLSKTFNFPVFSRLDPQYYVARTDGHDFDLNHFFENPEKYKSTFLPFAKQADLYIACHFWDNKSPHFLNSEDYKLPDFKIKVIADVSCDIGGPIASTFRASEIADPFYGYNPKTESEGKAFDLENITVMAVDNLPGEVPRDASSDFGKALIEKVFPSLFVSDENNIIKRATIAENGKLCEHFSYLSEFVKI